jgi:hypothetical protein
MPVYGFATADDFARARKSILKTERDVGTNRVPRPEGPRLGPDMQYLCKNNGTTWAKGTTRDVNIYTGDTQGSETDSGETLTDVYNRLGDIAANSWCYVFPVNGDKLEVWNATC